MMKQNISCQTGVESNDFPRDSLLASYALTLLELKEWSRSLLEMIFSLFPSGTGQFLANQLGALGSIDRLLADLLEATDEEAVARVFSEFIWPPNSKKSDYFIKLVVPLLKQKIQPSRRSYQRRVEQVCSKLNLSADEIALLELGCCYRISSGFENILDSYDYTRKISLVARLTSIPYARVAALISKSNRLVQNDLLDLKNKNLTMDCDLAYFLMGVSGKEFSASAFRSVSGTDLPLDAFNLAPVQKETLIQMLCSDAPAHLLFYGKPGTGKTEMAKALVSFCKRKAVCVDCGADGDEGDRKTALLVTRNSVHPQTIIIVDEVDVLLNTRHLFRENKVNKGWINQFLDGNRHKIIWITNEIGGIEESVRRRFSYSLHFKQLTWGQRESIWLRQLRKHRIKRFFKTADIQQYARQFVVSPGLIAYAIQTVSKCRSDTMSASAVQAIMVEVLTRQMELTEGETPEKRLNNINEHYDLQALNMDSDPEQLIMGLTRWKKASDSSGVSLLFWGWPGTGKTEFAKYLADRLGKELLVQRMSDLQSKWLGETEKNIARVFRVAEENDAILFLDESDSLFVDRQTAHHSWEISQTNEILTQMENFRGVLICCTNLLDHLDEAAMRRFAFKIKFLPLTQDGIQRLYRQYFGSIQRSLTSEQEFQLSGIRNLCPGDIKAVWQRTCFLGSDLAHEQILRELEKEVGYKRHSSRGQLGF